MTIGTPAAALGFCASELVQRIERHSLRVQQPASTGSLVSLAMGEPDFATPEKITRAAAKALEDGFTHYSPLRGEPALRTAIARSLAARAGTEFSADDVIVTQGGTAGLAAAILAVVNPGDRVVIPDPSYSLYADLVNMAGGTVVPVPLADDLHWDLRALAEALAGARLFVFCNPSNPTGIVHSRTELEALAAIVEASETLVLADEAYSELVYTPEPFTSALQLPGLRERTIYCQTFSKSYAMTGWRVGYLWGPTQVIDATARVHGTFNGSLNSAVQHAAVVALEQCQDDIAAMRKSYEARRVLMYSALSRIPGLALSQAEGAFYLFPRYELDIPSATLTAELRSFGVAVRPGGEFGAGGEHHLRLSYAASPEHITAGVERLAAGLSTLAAKQ